MTQRPPFGDTAAQDVLSTLGPLDLEVLRCLTDGHSTAQISASLSVSTNTVRTRIRRIQRKLAVTDREGMVRVAQELGVLLFPWPRPQVP
jgi:DNA-binding NarL/FixJ family response regulator